MKSIYHKFKASMTVRDGMKFPSKKEAGYYDQLKVAQKSGIVLFFLRQPMFDLPGGVKYRSDFLVFYTDGTVEVVEVKGFETKGWKMKKKMVESLYPIEIKVVK